MMVKTEILSSQGNGKRLLLVGLIVCMALFLVNFVSAFEFDNIKNERDTTFDGKHIQGNQLLEKYNPIEIKNTFGLGKTLFEGYLSQHDDTCGIDCKSTMQVKLNQDGVLIDDIIFETLQDDGSWIEQNIRSYQFIVNGEEYNLGEEVDAGTYEVELTGKKKPSRTVDWKIVTQGKLLESWAVWNGTNDLIISSNQEICGNYVGYNNIIINNSATVTVCAGGEVVFGSRGDFILETGAKIYGEGKGVETTGNGAAGATAGTTCAGGYGGASHNSSGGNGGSSSGTSDGSCGGGAAGSTYDTTDNMDSALSGSQGGGGGLGGATITIKAYNLTINGEIDIDGLGGGSGSGTCVGGGKGGGSAGNVIIAGVEVNISNANIHGVGGNGGSGYVNGGCSGAYAYAGAGGGGGSGGIISVFYENTISNTSLTTLVSGGSGGSGVTSGASAGAGGTGVVGTIYYSEEAVDLESYGLITLNSPTDNHISTTNKVTFNATATVIGGATLVNMSLWTNETGTWEIKNTTTELSGTTSTKTWNRTFSDGDNILWTVQACDSDGDCGFATENRTLTIDSSAPIVELISGNGTQNYGSLSQNHTINFTVTDSNLDTCWYDYNNTNNTFSCSSGVNDFNFTLEEGIYNLTLWANDSIGNENSQFVNWDYIFFEGSTTFEDIVYETDSKLFQVNITTGLTILTQSGKLNYNGTNYTTTSSCSSGVCEFSKSIDIPLISTGESENRTFYWALTLFDGTTSYNLNTAESTQNTTRIHLEECGGVYTTPTVNFTAYYETNLTRINPFYITGTFDNWLGSGNIYRTSSFNEASTADLKLCITPTDRTQYSNAHIEYKFDNENITFIPRNYFFQNKSLTNISEEINLFLLEAEDSTSFIIKVQDQKLSPVTEALVYIQKYYPSDGTYKTVQIARTDSNGETLGFYETETTDYKHTIIKNGVTLLETAQQKVVGKSVPYTLTFTIGQALGYPWTSFDDNLNVSINLTFDKDTNIVTFSYIENTTGYVTSGQLLVFQNSLTNSTTTIICNVTSTEASASLTCDLSSYNGTFIAIGYINEGSEKIIQFIRTDARDVFGNDGLFLGMMIIMVAGFAMMWNPSAGIISINAAVIFVNMIGFITVSPVFIFGMIAVSIITIMLLKT